MIRAGIIDEVFDNLGGRIVDHFEWVGAYAFIAEVVVGAIVALAALAVITYFIPFQWAKTLNGWIGSIIIALVVGAVMMFRHDRAENERLRAQLKELKKGGHQQGEKSSWW